MLHPLHKYFKTSKRLGALLESHYLCDIQEINDWIEHYVSTTYEIDSNIGEIPYWVDSFVHIENQELIILDDTTKDKYQARLVETGTIWNVPAPDGYKEVGAIPLSEEIEIQCEDDKLVYLHVGTHFYIQILESN